MDFFKKHWFKIFSIIIFVLLSIYVPFFAIKKALDFEIYKEPVINTKIYTLWHVETFEGGGRSRMDFLKAIARQLESENAGVLIMIKQIEPDALSNELDVNPPDMISFGSGVGKDVLSHLTPIKNTFDVDGRYEESGKFDNNIYALPYIASGYAMITHGTMTGNFHCGQNGYINPEIIYNSLNLSPAENESQYEAYKDFVYDKTTSLLGTARDVYRVSNLNKIGRTNAMITPVDSFTDLVQYFGLVTNDEITNKFLSCCLSDERQKSLVDYSLFTTKNFKIYSDGIYSQMEDCLALCEVKNVFE